MHSFSPSHSPSKSNISPSLSPDGRRPTYSILSDETRALMLVFLRKISSAIQHNERRLQEYHDLVEQERRKSLQTTQFISTSVAKLLRSFLSSFKSQSSRTENTNSKALLSFEIVEQLTNAKNKLSELFQVRNKKEKKHDRHTKIIRLAARMFLFS